MNEQLPAFECCPQPESCRLTNFERAEVRVLESHPSRYLLIVAGTKPCVNMNVKLIPHVYVQQPEYWDIEVVGYVPGGICLDALSPYTVILSDPPLGTKGIEVIGACSRERIEIRTEHSPLGRFALSITSATSGALIAKASLTCYPAGGSHPNPEDACKQLAQVDGRIDAIPPDEGPCPQVYKPVILRASGTWNGEDRRFEAEFSNQCEGIRATGGVLFAFARTGGETEASESDPTAVR